MHLLLEYGPLSEFQSVAILAQAQVHCKNERAMRLKLQNASTGVQKFLVTDASTLTGLLAAVTARLGVDCLRLCVDEVRIEDDADVATLQDGDIVQVFELVGVTAENDQVISDTDVTEPLINAEFTESPGVTKKSSFRLSNSERRGSVMHRPRYRKQLPLRHPPKRRSLRLLVCLF